MHNSILNKIQKLKAKADSAQELGNIHEAATFSAKVNELLTTHNLAMADLNIEDQSEVKGLKFSDLGVTTKQGRWTASLISILCEFNYCESIFHTSVKGYRHNKRGRLVRIKNKAVEVTIIGRPENVEVVKYLYSVLKTQFESLANQEWKDYAKATRHQLSLRGYAPSTPEYKKPWKYFRNFSTKDKFVTSFYLGAIHGVHAKLKTQLQKAESKHGSKITDLILVNDAAVKAYMQQHHPNLGSFQNRRKTVNSRAYNSGKQAGHNASMAKGVASGTRVATKMLN